MAPDSGAARSPADIRVQGSLGPIQLAPGLTQVEVGTIRLFMTAPPRDDADACRTAQTV